jgi:hypothetical protein
MALTVLGSVDLPPFQPSAFDHGDVHLATGRIFVAHTGAGEVEVIDHLQGGSIDARGQLGRRDGSDALGPNVEAVGDGQAAITGDYAMLPDEVQGVLGALRDNGIEVTALHSHMLMDSPHLLYAHFFAHGDPTALARGLRAALDRTKSAS